MPTTADIVIIGGGVMGCSIQYNLAAQGITNTILLEKTTLNAGSTGRSQAICRTHYSNPITATLAWQSLQIFANFDQIIGGPPVFTQTGYLVIVKETDRPGLHRNLAMMQDLGINTTAITPTDLREIAPMISVTDDEALAWEPQSGYADPYLVTSTYANRAQQLGAQIRLNTPATRIETAHHQVRAVHTPSGPIHTPTAVIAAGPWSQPLLAQTGLSVPLTTVRHQIAALTRPVDQLPHHPAVGDIAQSFSFRPDGPQMTLMGFGDDEPADPETHNPLPTMTDLTAAHQKLTRRIPQMSQSYFRGGWAGLFTTTPDWHPIIDQSPQTKGLYYAAGFSGHGFKLAPMIGQTLTQLITQTPTPNIDPSPLSQTRFTKNQPLQSSYHYRVLA